MDNHGEPEQPERRNVFHRRGHSCDSSDCRRREGHIDFYQRFECPGHSLFLAVERGRLYLLACRLESGIDPAVSREWLTCRHTVEYDGPEIVDSRAARWRWI